MTTKAGSLKGESQSLNRGQDHIKSSLLTPERVEQPPQTPGLNNEENLLAFLMKEIEALDAWLGGPPMSQRERVERDISEHEALTDIHLLGV